MASRGILRVGRKLSFQREYQWNVTGILCQTFKPDPASRSALHSPEKCIRQFSIGPRYLHSLTQSNSKMGKQLYAQHYRENNTMSFKAHEDSKEQEIESGDFDKNGISMITQDKLRAMGINHLFPVQYHTFRPTIEGTDVIVQARTGTGKTLSFALPIVEKLQNDTNRLKKHGRRPLVVVLAPTRELAVQVKEVFASLSERVKVTCVYGGASMNPQIESITRGVDVVVGTPGRTKDLIDQGVLNFSELEHVILDEVDRMLDMGFDEDVEEIISDCYKSGDKPQTMLYSATMPAWVKNAARRYLDDDYKMINLVGYEKEQTAPTVKQYAINCSANEQAALIRDFIHLYVKENGRAVVFCQTKRHVDVICSGVLRKEAKAFHGDIAQSARSYILQGFRDGRFKVLVTTDVAARGLDIPNIDLVIQTQPPQDLKYYIHRVGRTGRAGQTGMSILMYNRSTFQAMRDCEREAKVRFKNLAPPKIEEMLELCTKQAVSEIVKVRPEVASHFHEAAEILIEKKGGKEMLAAAMAIVSKAEAFSNRSLITREEGYNTLRYTKTAHSRSSLVAIDFIVRFLKGLNLSRHNIHAIQDGSGVVFDVEADNVDTVLKGFNESDMAHYGTIQRIDTLPDIVKHERAFSSQKSYKPKYGGRNFYRDDDDDEDHFHRTSKNRYSDSKRHSFKEFGNRYLSGSRYNQQADRFSSNRRKSSNSFDFNQFSDDD